MIIFTMTPETKIIIVMQYNIVIIPPTKFCFVPLVIGMKSI